MDYYGFSLCESLLGQGDIEGLDHMLQQMELAERAGLDGWFLAEHHSDASYSLTPSPNLLLAAASQRTQQIRIGNMVNVLPYHHPLRAAEEIRLLDALTGGRLEVGLGRGGIAHEQAAFGVDRRDAPSMFSEGVKLLLRFLTEDSVDYDTSWWSGVGATAVPEATQRPHPPLWLSSVSDESVERAARLGINCMTSFSYTQLLHSRMKMYRDCWKRYRPGEPAGKFAVLVPVVVAEREHEAMAVARGPVEQKLRGLVNALAREPGTALPGGATRRARVQEHISELSFSGLIEEQLVIFGSVEQCVEQLERLRATGVDMLTAWLQFKGLDQEFVDRSLQLFGEEVVTRVERAERD